MASMCSLLDTPNPWMTGTSVYRLTLTDELGNVGPDILTGARHSQDGNAVDEAARVTAYVFDALISARK